MHESPQMRPITAVVASMLEGTIELSCVSRTLHDQVPPAVRPWVQAGDGTVNPPTTTQIAQSCSRQPWSLWHEELFVRQGDICECVSHDAMESIENTGGIAS
jgi:hypothetical protein